MSFLYLATYLGYKAEDYAATYARFYNETIKDVSPVIREALRFSPYAAGMFPAFEKASYLKRKEYTATENGYSFEDDGSVNIACLTKMPGVTPAMWHWWFGWHGCAANRYKLWHPKAHVSAQWKDGDQSLEAYINRTSLIEEYIGTKLEKASIQFFDPCTIGLQNTEDTVYICARIGYTSLPVNFGWLIHQVRKTEYGAEMRSRFWIGGQYIQIRLGGSVSKYISSLLQKLVKPGKQQAIDLLMHCSEEMNHLAAFLPSLYQQYNQ